MLDIKKIISIITKHKPKMVHLVSHETKKHALLKFVGLLIIVIFYFILMSLKFGTKTGIYTTILTWSFFIFCTPIADAGFLLAFPVRLITGLRMMYTQIISLFIALGINLYAFFVTPSIYDNTIILKLFHHILSQPIPFWGIIILSLLGTILSIYFGDELIDVTSHSQRKKYHKHLNKYQIIVFLFLIAITFVLYDILLNKMGLNIPL